MTWWQEDCIQLTCGPSIYLARQVWGCYCKNGVIVVETWCIWPFARIKSLLLSYLWRLPWLVNLDFLCYVPLDSNSLYICSSNSTIAVSKLSFVCYCQHQRAVNPDRDDVETGTFNSHHLQILLSGLCRYVVCRNLSAFVWLTWVSLQKTNLQPDRSFPSLSRATSRFVT